MTALVRSLGSNKRGAECWEIVDADGTITRVSASPSSVRVMDRITVEHADALMRLAGK